MASSGIVVPGSLNLAVNPLNHQPGDMIRCINVTNDQIGSKKKRPGYQTYLGTAPNGSVIQDLMNYTRNNGTQLWNYALAGGMLYYSTQGTGAWTICGNGTLSSLGTLCSSVLEDTLLVSDGVGSIRHSTDGTSFTNTTNSPVTVSMKEFQQRIYAAGTASTLFWSNVGTPSDWTNNSSSINIPGAGKLLHVMKTSNGLVTSKNSGIQHRWDGYNLVDLSTNLGITSSRSVASVEQFRLGLNTLGVYSYSDQPQPSIISNAVEKQIYNDAGEGIAGTSFNNAEGVIHKYEYMLSVGTVTDDLTDETVADAILVYDYQMNEWWNNKFANRPRAWLSYRDATQTPQLIFASGNKCYTYGGTNLNDNGTAIEVVMEGVISMGTLLDKKWNFFRALFNPGAEAQVQIAISDTFTRAKKRWINLGQALDGIVEYRFPEGSLGKLLFWKIIESSRNSRLQFYSFEYDAEIEE
jgi:hypothetical protein